MIPVSAYWWKRFVYSGLGLCLVCMIAGGCVSSVDPAKVDLTLEKSRPETKLTSYTETLHELGLMTEIYDTGELLIQSDPVGDNTGASGHTGGEIPRDITEILKSTLNSIGGNIRYIPYDPAYIQNMNVTGYSDFSEKLIPEVVVSGGITEFDRGLETRGKGTDAGVDASFTNAPRWTPADSVGLNYGDNTKQGLARITLDFNLLDFKTMAGIPRMNTVNTMEVRKGLREKEMGITLFGPTFGRKGSVKKVQGRHAAIRVLVEVSMIQMVGKYLGIPYWTMLGKDADPDPVVIKQVKRYYYSISPMQRIQAIQQWMFLYGHNLSISGQLDVSTQTALRQIVPDASFSGTDIDFNSFLAVYTNIPIDESTLQRRNMLNNILASGGAYSQPAPQQPAYQNQQSSTTSYQSSTAASQKYGKSTSKVTKTKSNGNRSSAVEKPKTRQGNGIGRRLTDEEW